MKDDNVPIRKQGPAWVEYAAGAVMGFALAFMLYLAI